MSRPAFFPILAFTICSAFGEMSTVVIFGHRVSTKRLLIIIRVKHTPATMTEGDEMDFTMWLGSVPGAIRGSFGHCFTDRLLRGSFADKVNQCTFVAVDE